MMINLSNRSNENMEKVMLQFCYKKTHHYKLPMLKLIKQWQKNLLKIFPFYMNTQCLWSWAADRGDMVRDVLKIKIVDKKSVEYDKNDITSASKNLIQCTYDNEENDSENDSPYPGDSFESLMMHSIMETLHQIIQTDIIVRYKNRIITRIRFYCNNTKIFGSVQKKMD